MFTGRKLSQDTMPTPELVLKQLPVTSENKDSRVWKVSLLSAQTAPAKPALSADSHFLNLKENKL